MLSISEDSGSATGIGPYATAVAEGAATPAAPITATALSVIGMLTDQGG